MALLGRTRALPLPLPIPLPPCQSPLYDRRTPMTPPVSGTVLDDILAIQLSVAWAGEGRCEPRRLGWWETDLVDLRGGGDLMTRLLPRTAAWAGLEAVRDAAIRMDAKARRALPDPDKVRTLFFLGFELDEQLGDRLRQLKQTGGTPPQALRLLADPLGSLQPRCVRGCARDVGNSYTVVPAGRQLRSALPAAPADVVRALAMALVPFQPNYPMPFFRLST